GVQHLIFGEFTLRPVGANEITSIPLPETRADAGILKTGIVEVRQHRFSACVIHGMSMLGVLPGLVLLGMAAGTTGAAGKLSRLVLGGFLQVGWWCVRDLGRSDVEGIEDRQHKENCR